MNKISRILIPYNFKESATNALEYAMAFSENAPETQIQLQYTLSDEPQEKIEEIEKKLADLADIYSSRFSHVDVSSLLRKGEIVSSILNSKAEFNADVIVMGTKGSTNDSESRNTNTSKLIHQAECPVIVVPKSFKKFNLEHITLAIDKSEIEKPDLLQVLLVIARRFDAKIHVLTVYDEHDEDFLKDRDNESILEYYFERYYSTSSATRSSNIAESIIDYDKKQSIDMLAIIPRNHAKAASEGKLTQYLTKRTDIPILTID